MKLAYVATVALSAFLLFSLEPMVTRLLLPELGGSSAVWLTALAFFQLVLLLGYAYATWAGSASGAAPARWRVHLGLLALSTATVVFAPAWHPLHAAAVAGNPQLRLFAGLATSVGLPFATLSTTSPLLQAWYARREQVAVPYRLFALSNFASLSALLAYPTLLEPYLPLDTQFLLWRCGFILYVLMDVALTLRVRSAVAAPVISSAWGDEQAATATPNITKLRWFALAAAASLQLAATTAHLTQDIASMPLLWIIPLAAYLLSFVLAFEFPRLYSRALVVRLLAVLLFALGYFLLQTGMGLPIGLSIGLFTAELFVVAWFCHAELFQLRPSQAAASTGFYLWIAAGAAAGTLVVAIVSPLVTDSNFDLPASFLLTAALLLWITWSQGWPHRLLWSTGTALGLYLLIAVHSAYAVDALFRARNFYGAIRVKQTQTPPQAYLARTLYNGNIQHGMQWFSDASHRTPLTYYAADSGVGLTLQHCCSPARPRRIGVIGLGAGTLAAYGGHGDQMVFYDINPLVVEVAQHLFTYTRDTPASVTIIPGDARLSLSSDSQQVYDVLVVDAFTGDSIPTHLLTREALALYLRHLAPGGVLAFHISNQYLDLAPVLARLAEATPGGQAHLLAREVDSGPDADRGELLASWVLLTSHAAFFRQPELAGVARPVTTDPRVRLWTDQYSSLYPIVRWSGRHAAPPRVQGGRP